MCADFVPPSYLPPFRAEADEALRENRVMAAPEDLAAIEAAIYDQSFRALDEQARVLDALRARAGALVAGASVATALLGGLAGAARPDVHAQLDSMSWVAIGLFVAVLLLSLFLMTPGTTPVFSHHPHLLMSAYLNRRPPLSLADYRSAITYYNGRHFDANARQLRGLLRMLVSASVCLASELVLWLWILAR
jgi:hypothetical protein